MEDTGYTWFSPQYDTSRPPSLKTTLQPSQTEDFPENFARTAKWCPDGSTFLTHCEDRSLQLFTTSLSDDPAAQPTTFHQPSPILDFIWYPTASPLTPPTYCFIASVRDCPIKLLDASDGRLRASYRIVDHRERQVAPHSLAFDLTAERLYCGFEDAIEVFDISRPGHGTRLPTTPSKKSKDGLKGIISALAFIPSQGSDTYAAGSLYPTPSNIALFSSTQGPEPIMFVSGGPSAGVTQIQFNILTPHLMYTAHRRHETIYAWDLRSHLDAPLVAYKCTAQVDVESGESKEMKMRTRTNQKLKFDVDLGGRWLASGDHVYAIGSVSFHPLYPTLLSVSGSRHFESESDSDSEDSEDDEDGGILDVGSGRQRVIQRTRPKTLDRSIKTWSFEFDSSEARIPPEDRAVTG
ncbi:Telomerase Cajal body protein 1 [Termitomyces sp. J132]|nr:Telomerase Cajal body protein 1 [Termitomyces sp. J132]